MGMESISSVILMLIPQVIMLFIEDVQLYWMKYCYFRAHNLTPILVFSFCFMFSDVIYHVPVPAPANMLGTYCHTSPLCVILFLSSCKPQKTPSISCFWECCFTTATEKYITHAYMHIHSLRSFTIVEFHMNLLIDFKCLRSLIAIVRNNLEHMTTITRVT